MSKLDFLNSVRVARSLLTHRVNADDPRLDPETVQGQLARAAIWLTPSAVRGFDVRDFRDLSPDRRSVLQEAVAAFLQVARQVPPDGPATLEQIQAGMAEFRKILDVLGPDLPDFWGTGPVREALERVRFPDFVVNWIFEVGDDSTGDPAAWIHVFVKDEVADRPDLVEDTTEIRRRIRLALNDAGIARWPYVRFRTASEQRSLENIAS